MIQGFATPEGTARFASRFKGKLDPSHFRLKKNLSFSSIGIGSYLGDPDAATDAQYEEALELALLSGINVVDSAINYRAQRSERSFGKALRKLIEDKKIQRDEIILCTKGGFIPFDGSYVRDPSEYFQKTYVETGILKTEEVAQGCHAMTPQFLENQLSRSLYNLEVTTLDIYYLHNPETQLGEVSRSEFLNRIRKAFEWFESKVAEGKIKRYGTATWNGFRVPPHAKDSLSMEELNCVAREVGGRGHHFCAVQLPVNLAMPEAWISENQSFGAMKTPLLNVAEQTDFIVIGSASLLQASLANPLPEALSSHFKDLAKPAQQALQFARSLRGMTSSLVGMKSKAHVLENLEVAKVPLLQENQILAMFQ